MLIFMGVFLQVESALRVVDVVEHTGTIAVLTLVCIAEGFYIWWLHVLHNRERKDFNQEREIYVKRLFDSIFLVGDVIRRLGSVMRPHDKETLEEKFREALELWNDKKNKKSD